MELSSNVNEWIPPEFMLLLKPQKGVSQNEVHATINLRVKFSHNYPQCSPSIKLENPQGVSSKDVEKLQLELEKICENFVGEEVSFNLAHHAQSFLAERNQRPRFQSFHEEMLATQKNNIEKSVLEEKYRQVKEDEQQLIAFCEEIQKKQPALLSELRRMTRMDDSTQLPFLDINLPPVLSSTCKNETLLNQDIAIESPKICTHPTPRQISFTNKDGGRVYHCGPCLGSCQPNRFVCTAVETNLKESAAITTFKVPHLLNIMYIQPFSWFKF